jgi:hypothetical protein
MIRPPKRAVTRFFIPLIDVLILLYCIFLLMPFVEKGAANRLTPGDIEALRRRIARLEEELAKAGQAGGSPEEVRRLEEELREERSKRASDRVNVKTLYVDRDKLTLYRYEQTAGGARYRREITNASEAVELATADAKEDPSKELLYIVFYPPGRPAPRGWEDKAALWFGRLARLDFRPQEGGGGS